MTAEVAVMNSMGIALAADSAVTLGSAADKIYTSAEKLFELSGATPVGVMVHGNASFAGVPWETIIKCYRTHLSDTRFDTIREYGDDLISWLPANLDLFPEDLRDQQIVLLLASYFLFLRKKIEESITRAAKEKGGLGEDDLADLLDGVVKCHLRLIRQSPRLADFPKDFQRQLRRKFSSALRKLKIEVFGQLPFKPSTKRLLSTVAVELLSRHYFGPLQCGVVIAGFGEKQYMPALVSYDLEEMVGSRIRALVANDAVMTNQGSASVIPFAQKDMVYAFMEGIDRELDALMMESTSELFLGFFESLVDLVRQSDAGLGEHLHESVEPSISDLVSGLFDKWQQRRRSYWEPVLQVVSALPKDELAEMAEALVNLTKFRRRVTIVPETVGGPVDVAVITKGDGFVWIRRKRYFDPALNPRFLAT